MRILTVEDDAETATLIGRALTSAGFEVVTAASLAEASSTLADNEFALIVLDVMLSDGSGLDLCRRLRSDGLATPILFLSARGTVRARVDGLDAGGDDYLPKPFAVRELVARANALCRRGPVIRRSRVRAGQAEIDFEMRHVQVGDVEVPVTAREWDVLAILADARGRVVTFDDILERAWGATSEQGKASLEVIISRLRKKLGGTTDGPGPLRTLRGVGYALDQA